MARSGFPPYAAHIIGMVSGLVIAASPVGAQQLQDQTAARFPAATLTDYSNQVTIGDLDGDGDLDLVFANGGNTNTAGTPQPLRIFINDGTGVFADETNARTGVGDPPVAPTFLARGAELGDIDRDGDLDLIVAQDFNRQPQLFVNDGLGFFTNQTATRLPAGTFSSSRAQFGDVDNDGDLDLVFTNGGATSHFGAARTKLWRNDGTGVFSDATTTNTPNISVSEPADVIFGDIDGDFDLDMRIASTAVNHSRVYRNNGAGVFANLTGQPPDRDCKSYDFGDIDGDLDFDLLGMNGHNTTANGELLLNNPGNGVYTALAWTGPVPAVDDCDSKFFDFDNDGDMDMIIASRGVTERAYANNGVGGFSSAAGIIQSISDSSLDIKVADLDGDGRYDVVTAQGEGGEPYENRIYMNVSGPVDTLPPTIRTEQLPPGGEGAFVVRAIITDAHTSDRGFHDKGVFLHYSNDGAVAKAVPMAWSGNSLWRGVIPAQNSSGTIEYHVTATDFADNTAIGPTKVFDVQLPCPSDTTGDKTVNVVDLLSIIAAWGENVVTHEVEVEDSLYDPQIIDVKSGDSVHWSNIGGQLHTVTSGTPCTGDGRFNATVTTAAPDFTYTIPHAFEGTIPYFCIPHCGQGMTGTINVAPFKEDVNHDGVVNVQDLLKVISDWGACP